MWFTLAFAEAISGSLVLTSGLPDWVRILGAFVAIFGIVSLAQESESV